MTSSYLNMWEYLWSQLSESHSFPVVLVCSGSHNKIPQTGQLELQKYIFSQFWSLEVQDQDAKASLISGACWRLPGSWVATRHHGLTWPSLFTRAERAPVSSYKDIIPVRSGTSPRTSFKYNYLPSSRCSHTGGEALTWEFWGETI